MPTATTLAQVMRQLCTELGQTIGQVPTTSTTTGIGSTTTAVDTALTLPDSPVSLMDNSWFRVDSLVASGPASGTVRQIRKGGFTGASGTMTLAAFAQTVQSLTDYSIWRSMHPARVLLFVQQACRLMRVRDFYPLSLVTNPDFAAVTSGSGPDNWTATGLTQTTTSGYTTLKVRHGQYAARALLSAPAGYLQSNTVDVVPGGTYFASVTMRADVGTGILSLYDITNSQTLLATAGWANIAWAGRHYVEAYSPRFMIPVGTQQVAMRLAGTNTSDDINFDDAVLWRYDRRDYSQLPSWIEDPADIDDIGYFVQGRAAYSASTNPYVYDVDQRDFVSVRYETEGDEGVGNAATSNPFRVRLAEYSQRPLYIYSSRPMPTLVNDTDSTTVDREVLVKTALWLCVNDLVMTATAQGKADEKASWLERRENIGRDARLAGALGRLTQRHFHAEGMRPGKY